MGESSISHPIRSASKKSGRRISFANGSGQAEGIEMDPPGGRSRPFFFRKQKSRKKDREFPHLTGTEVESRYGRDHHRGSQRQSNLYSSPSREDGESLSYTASVDHDSLSQRQREFIPSSPRKASRPFSNRATGESSKNPNTYTCRRSEHSGQQIEGTGIAKPQNTSYYHERRRRQKGLANSVRRGQ